VRCGHCRLRHTPWPNTGTYAAIAAESLPVAVTLALAVAVAFTRKLQRCVRPPLGLHPVPLNLQWLLLLWVIAFAAAVPKPFALAIPFAYTGQLFQLVRASCRLHRLPIQLQRLLLSFGPRIATYVWEARIPMFGR